MAIKHHLQLDIPETACDTILRVIDGTVYAEEMDVDCPRLDIYIPGSSTPIYIETPFVNGLIKNISQIDLGLQAEDCDTLNALPDGLYKIKYSVAPNEEVYVEYYHLRVTRILNDYYNELCKVQLQTCEPNAEQHQLLHDLRYIRMYIDGAIAKTEYCHSPNEGVDMLSYANKLLNKYKTGCCVTCNS